MAKKIYYRMNVIVNVIGDIFPSISFNYDMKTFVNSSPSRTEAFYTSVLYLS